MSDRRIMALAGLGLLVAICTLGFMLIGLRGNLAFALELRGVRLLALVQVGVAIGISTVLFQTVTGNRILTPSIMGLDALYVLGQTVFIFVLGGLGFAGLDPWLKFGGEVGLMMALALALFVPILRARLDMTLMLLGGVVLGLLFRSLTSFLARLIDPNDFAVVQGASFASFNAVEPGLLAVGTALTALCTAIAWRARHVLDVISLGPDAATGLGVGWHRSLTGVLVLVAVLVAVSTALVGPVAFFGLLAVALAERIVNTRRHDVLLPAAALVAVAILVGGQTLLQHALGGVSTLGVIIEFLGGLVFLVLLFLEVRR